MKRKTGGEPFFTIITDSLKKQPSRRRLLLLLRLPKNHTLHFLPVALLLLLLHLPLIESSTSSRVALIKGSAIKCSNEGETVKVPLLSNDPCIKCKCLNSEIVCNREQCSDNNKSSNSNSNIACHKSTCPPLDCPPASQVLEPGECCPTCFLAHQPKLQCSKGSRTFNNGEKWRTSRCTTCACINGDIVCKTQSCSKQLSCGERQKLVRQTGECCPICVEHNAQCTMTKIPSKIHTFDGKSYDFEGKCNYVFTRDCQKKSFAVHLVNDSPKNVSVMENSTNYNVVVMKFEKSKIRLLANGTIKIGRKTVSPPFLKLGMFSIVVEDGKTTVRANMGVKVTWNGKNLLDVLIAPHFKNKLCGLCGNFNGKEGDDMVTKAGELTTNLDKFVRSWKVGKSASCAVAAESRKVRIAVKTRKKCGWDSKRRKDAMKACSILRSRLFKECHNIVPVAQYYRSCLLDSCNCQTSEPCHCNATNLYISHCKNARVEFPKMMDDDFCTKLQKKDKCPRGMIFAGCSSQCKRTCRNFRKERSCKKPCKPGCTCPAPTVWHNGRCVRPRHCALPIIESASFAVNTTGNTRFARYNLKELV